MKIYIASKSVHAPKWRALRDLGVPISSTWIDEAGAGETQDWPALWKRCLKEAKECDLFIIYIEAGEVLRGAYVEMGAALSGGKAEILWVGPREGSVSKAGGIQFADSVETALLGRAQWFERARAA